jgi:ribonuclease D
VHGTEDHDIPEVSAPGSPVEARSPRDATATDQGRVTPVTAPPTPLLSPRDGVPGIVDTPTAFAATVAAFGAGTGPVAVDAERASGHRYGQRAFLVQLRRAGAGTALVDPAALGDLSPLGEAIADAEWVLHAASQDLPCLADAGMRPRTLFDTELGSRIAGYPRVGLASVVEQLLGFTLAKEHSAVDWSVRPLPAPWLRYAALDVEVLIELRNALEADLRDQGKLDWALQEFDAVVRTPVPPPRPDPWRRTSGMHRLRTQRQIAVVRELWHARDDLAREQDISPGRLLPDSSLVEAAREMPADAQALMALPKFTGRGARRHLKVWIAAVERGRRLGEAELPPQHLPSEGPPPTRVWADRDPRAAARLTACRAAMTELSTRLRIPVENILAPDSLRRLAWSPPTELDTDSVADALRVAGARPWQRDLTVPVLVPSLRIDGDGS